VHDNNLAISNKINNFNKNTSLSGTILTSSITLTWRTLKYFIKLEQFSNEPVGNILKKH